MRYKQKGHAGQKIGYFQALQLAIIAIFVSLVGFIATQYECMSLFLVIVSTIAICTLIVMTAILSVIIFKKISELEDL